MAFKTTIAPAPVLPTTAPNKVKQGRMYRTADSYEVLCVKNADPHASDKRSGQALLLIINGSLAGEAFRAGDFSSVDFVELPKGTTFTATQD